MQEREKKAMDLLKLPITRTLFRSPKVIMLIRLVVLGLFVYGVYLGFAIQDGENIFTVHLFWSLFWSLFIVSTLVLLGRVFCGICPHAFLGEYLTRFGLKKKMPKWLAHRYIGMMLLFLGWWGTYYVNPTLFKTPLATAVLFAVMSVVAYSFFFLFKEMSYCKHICPIGTMMRAYNRMAPTWLGSDKNACSSCKTFECAHACSYHLKPFSFDQKKSMDDCTLCMNCAVACDAITFEVKKPSSSLFEKFNANKTEVWAYVLITAAIPISMNFHHALGRTGMAHLTPWAQTAEAVSSYVPQSSIDMVGLFAFIYATIMSVGIAVLGMYIASKILKETFSRTFYTLGYAFAPIFLIGGLSHMLQVFFTREYADIVNAFIYGFHLDSALVSNLASRADSWPHVFKVFPYIATLWGVWIVVRRMRFFNAPKKAKVVAGFFASALIGFYLAMNIYAGYAFSHYGVKASSHHRHQ